MACSATYVDGSSAFARLRLTVYRGVGSSNGARSSRSAAVGCGRVAFFQTKS
jgi:hypothetical protein